MRWVLQLNLWAINDDVNCSCRSLLWMWFSTCWKILHFLQDLSIRTAWRFAECLNETPEFSFHNLLKVVLLINSLKLRILFVNLTWYSWFSMYVLWCLLINFWLSLEFVWMFLFGFGSWYCSGFLSIHSLRSFASSLSKSLIACYRHLLMINKLEWMSLY